VQNETCSQNGFADVFVRVLLTFVSTVAKAQDSQSTNTEEQNSSNDAAAHRAQMQKHVEWLGQIRKRCVIQSL
jgi:hypothetical protein